MYSFVSVFDLLFLLMALATLASLGAAAAFAVAGRRSRALRILGMWGLGGCAYLAVGLAVSLVRPQRILGLKEPWCFDDWCLTVSGVTTASEDTDHVVTVGLRLFSRAAGRSERALGAWVYLVDERGRRFGPEAGASDIPLDTLLAPGESLVTSRSFRIPSGIRPVGLVTGHGGGYCGAMSILIIGSSGCLFGKPAMVGLP
ncbi:MAG: hypothetical protein R3E98_00005 [Gemmatimonadota bacterium]